MKLRFLLDENEPPRLKAALLRLNPNIDVLRVGEPGAPDLGTLDPDLLRYLDISQRALVTSNRASMPGHIEAHFAVGGHLWGMFIARPGTPVAVLAQELYLIWEASEAEEWIDQISWLPY
jgi:hypothetical protein